MGEYLGEAVLDLDADLGPLDRSLIEAERKTALWLATTQAMIDRGMGPISTRIAGVGTAFDQQLTSPLARFGAATDIMAKKVDGSLAQIRLEQAATAREMERAATVAEAAGRVQVSAAERSARAYEEQAAAAKAAADAGDEAARRRDLLAAAFGPNEPRPASNLPAAADAPTAQRVIERVGGSELWGVRGPHAAGSIGNPVVMVMEAANRTGLGSLAAAVGESSASGGARSTTIAEGGGGAGPTTVVATSGGSGGGGVPPVAISTPGAAGGGGGGGGGGAPFAAGALTDMVMGRHGGGGRPPGWLGYALGPAIGATASIGSLGSFAGFGLEHLLTTILGLVGSAAGGAVGGGLLGLGTAGKLAVGGGSDLAVMKSTIADTKQLAEAYKNVQTAVGKYGAESKQAAMAQHELNMLVAELGGTAGVKAELGLAKQAEALNTFWDKATSNARVQAVGILSQVLALGTDFVPKVAQAAEINLAVINKGIKPLFGWLEGPQGMGIFNSLEDKFRHDLPTAIHAGTQAAELFLRVVEISSRYTGGFTRSLDHLFTRLNSMDSATLSTWVGKMVADFRIWEQLIKVVGEDIFFMFKQDAGTATAIVTGITHALERVREWEKSTRGSAQLQSIFMIHKEQLEALGHLIPPLVSAFSKLYLAIAPTAVEATITLITKVLLPFVEALSWVASQGKAAATAMGLLLISFKAFGVGSTLSGLKSAFGYLTGAETDAAAAANADAAAQSRLAGAEVGAGAGAGAGAGGGILARLGLAGTRAQGAVETGALAVAGGAEKAGMTGTASRVAAVGGELGPIVGATIVAALPAILSALATQGVEHVVKKATGSSGVLGGFGRFLTGGEKGVAESGNPLNFLSGGFSAAFGGGGSKDGTGPVEIKSIGEASHESSKQLGELIRQIEHVKDVKVDGIAEPWKQVVAQLKLAKHAQDEWNASWNKSWTAIHNFSLGSGPVLKELFDRFDTNFRNIAHTMGLNSSAGRKLAEDNVSQMVDHIGRSIHSGAIPVDAGMSAISNVIAKYTKATGEETPKIYELMFNKIGVLYKRGEIGTSTAFHAYSTIAETETHHMVSEVETKQRDLFANLKTLHDEGLLTDQQYADKARSIHVHTANVVEAAMTKMTEGIIGAIEAGALSSKDGLSVIGKNLNSLLVQFGGKPLPLPKLEAYVAVTGANKVAGQAVKGITEFDAGGLVQFGRPGESGRDSIFLNMGGADIAVAPGEVGAVFNRHQLPEVNAALEERGWGGGLHGLFSGITTPHYMASGGFFPAAGTNYSVGAEPMIAADLQRLARSLGLHLIGLSGYRTPTHSVEVGGFANDPHTRGEASDTPGIEGVSESVLEKFGLTRPFPGSAEADHIQLLHGGHGFNGVPISGAKNSGTGTPPQWTAIKSPHVSGPGALAAIANAGLAKATAAANKYGEKHAISAHMGAAAGGRAAGSAQMRTWAKEGLEAAGVPATPANIGTIVARMMQESGGNPRSINLWDSNAKAGHPSQGLMELIPENFRQYHVPGTSMNIDDPVANVAAAVRYMLGRYGHLVGSTGSGYARGGLVGMASGASAFAPGGILGHAAARTPAPPKVGKPKGVRHVKRPAKPHALSLKHMITSLGAIPGMHGIGAELGPQEGTYNLLSDEENLLSSMTSNPASILASDMAYLNPTLVAGEDIGPGMLVTHAERELQRALQAGGETSGLTLQGSLLQWIGGLDDHRLLSGPDIGVLAKDFAGHAGHTPIHGVPLGVGYPVFKGQQSVLEAQVRAQLALVHIQRMEKDRAVKFIKQRQKRKARLERLLRAVYNRYRNIQKRLALLKSAGLRRKLSQAQHQHAAAVAHQQEQQDVAAHRSALQDAIASEKELNPWERNEALLHGWQAEERHLSGVLTKPPPSTAAISNAQEAIERNDLTNEAKALGEQLHVLGGNSTSIGTGGEWAIETKQISGLKTGADELDAKIRESVQSTIPQLELSIAGIRESLAEEAESVAPATIPSTEKPGESELAALLKQQNEQLTQQLAVSQAQYKVFANLGDLPPFAGRFHQGGIVPGPLGAERMALVQGGEVISQPGSQVEAHVHVADGMSWLKDLIRVEVRQGTRVSARSAGSPLPSRGGGQL